MAKIYMWNNFKLYLKLFMYFYSLNIQIKNFETCQVTNRLIYLRGSSLEDVVVRGGAVVLECGANRKASALSLLLCL